jgi:hypothetical protein
MGCEIDEVRTPVMEFVGKVRLNFAARFELIHYRVMKFARLLLRWRERVVSGGCLWQRGTHDNAEGPRVLVDKCVAQ